MKSKLQTMLCKVETTYGTDPTPSAATNCIAVQNIDVNPVEMETDDQETVSDRFGQDEKIVGATWCTISFDFPLRGSGTAGTTPNFDPVLRSSAMARVITPGTSVVYSNIDSGDESCALYYYQDGSLQKMVGVRGSIELKFNARKAALATFKGIGLRVPMTDAPMPTVTLPTLPRPVAVNKANTTATFGAYSAKLSALSIAQGNDVKYRNLTGREDVQIVDRTSSGSATIEQPLISEKNFLGAGGIISEALTDTLTVVHGATAGNILTLAVAAAQFLKPKKTVEDGIVMLGCDLHIIRNNFTLSFT